MSVRHVSKSELQQLLAQLARFFGANEATIAADKVSKCLDRISPGEVSALHCLFSLLFVKKTRGSGPVSRGVLTLNPSDTAILNHSKGVVDTASVVETVSYQHGLSQWPCGDGHCQTDHDHEYEGSPTPPFACQRPQISQRHNNRGSLSQSFTEQHTPIYSSMSGESDNCSGLHGGDGPVPAARPDLLHISAPTSEQFNDQPMSSPSFRGNTHLLQQAGTNSVAVLARAEPPVSRQIETTPGPSRADGNAFNKTSLAACTEIAFAPSTRDLFEQCKTDRGRFLHAIKEAKATLPTGQGWEAAIATKKGNADIRDLTKIFHRFECHNIYKHVVEAGFHTGTHWIRDMRAQLANKLCHDFPGRFPDQKTANKTLNWVDQGCRYDQWAGMFSETTDLGYLIALPADISHSAYTSRCTKEQMHAAAQRLKGLGIEGLVKQFELSELAAHISAMLRAMTNGKRKEGNADEINQTPWKSPRSTSASVTPSLSSQAGQNPTPPASLAAVNFRTFRHPDVSLVPACSQEDSPSREPRHESTSSPSGNGWPFLYNSFNAETFPSPSPAPFTGFNDWCQSAAFAHDGL